MPLPALPLPAGFSWQELFFSWRDARLLRIRLLWTLAVHESPEKAFRGIHILKAGGVVFLNQREDLDFPHPTRILFVLRKLFHQLELET